MMRINGTNTGNANAPAGLGMTQGNDAVSRNLQSQIANAQKQLQELSKNQEMSPEEKMKKRQELNQQITDLNQQLKQHQVELRRQKQAEMKSSSTMESEGGTKVKSSQAAGFSTDSMQAVLSADTALKQAKVQGSVKADIKGRSRVLKAEIEQDEKRGVNVEAKKEALAELEQRMSDVTNSQMKTLNDVNKKLTEAGKATEDSEKEESTVKKAEDYTYTEKEKGIHKEEEEKTAAVKADDEEEILYTPVDVRL